MRKLIIAAVTVASLAALAVPALASASVERYQNETATFTVTQPAGAYNQWGNVWTHTFNVTVNPCDSTFTGNGLISGSDQNGPVSTPHESVTGSFGNGTVSLTATRDDGLVTSLTNARTSDLGQNAPITTATLTKDGSVVNTPDAIEMKVSAPVITGSSSFKNHGDYVSSMGGGADAAHSCIGMPIQ